MTSQTDRTRCFPLEKIQDNHNNFLLINVIKQRCAVVYRNMDCAANPTTFEIEGSFGCTDQSAFIRERYTLPSLYYVSFRFTFRFDTHLLNYIGTILFYNLPLSFTQFEYSILPERLGFFGEQIFNMIFRVDQIP